MHRMFPTAVIFIRWTAAGLLLVAALACGDGGGEGVADPPRAASIAFVGAPSEGDAGTTLALTVEVRDQGGSPFGGASVSLSGEGGASVTPATVTTGANGRASTNATLPNIEGTAALEARTGTLTARTTIAVRGFAVDRVAAIAAARQGAVDEAADGCFVVAHVSQAPLAAGTVIRDAMSPPGTEPLAVLSGPSWFVFLDLLPLHRWAHPVRYLLIDAGSGAVTTHEAFGPPMIEGGIRYMSLRERLEGADRFHPEAADDVEGEACIPPESLASPAAVRGLPAGRRLRVRPLRDAALSLAEQAAEGARIVAVVINGGHPDIDEKTGEELPDENGFDADARTMREHLEALGAEVSSFGYRDHTLLDAINGARQAAQGLGPDDKFALYYVGHGLEDYLSYGAGTEVEAWWDIATTDDDFGLLGLLGDIPAGTINVMIDACHSGSAAIWMDSPFSGEPFMPGLPGTTLHLFTASAWNRTANALRNDHPLAVWLRQNPKFKSVASLGTYTEGFATRLGARDVDADGDGVIEVHEIEAAWKAEHDAQAAAMAGGQAPPPVKTVEHPLPPPPTLQPGLRNMGDMRQVFRGALLAAAFKDLINPLPFLAFGGGTASGGSGGDDEGMVGVYDMIQGAFVMQRFLSFYVWGVAGMLNPPGAQAAAALFAWSTGGFALYTATSPFGEDPDEMRTDIRVNGATHAGGEGPSDAIVFGSQDLGVGFVRFDPDLGRFAVSAEVLPMSDFFGDRIYPYIDAADAPALVLARSQNSRLYYHPRGGGNPTVVTAGLGTVGNLRCLPPICIVFRSGALDWPIFLFDGQNPPTRAADAAMDFQALEAALRRLPGGGVAALVVGRSGSAGRVAEVAFAADGSVAQVVPVTIPAGCSSPNGAAYVPDAGGAALVVSCTTTHNLFVERSALFPPP